MGGASVPGGQELRGHFAPDSCEATRPTNVARISSKSSLSPMRRILHCFSESMMPSVPIKRIRYAIIMSWAFDSGADGESKYRKRVTKHISPGDPARVRMDLEERIHGENGVGNVRARQMRPELAQWQGSVNISAPKWTQTHVYAGADWMDRAAHSLSFQADIRSPIGNSESIWSYSWFLELTWARLMQRLTSCESDESPTPLGGNGWNRPLPGSCASAGETGVHASATHRIRQSYPIPQKRGQS